VLACVGLNHNTNATQARLLAGRRDEHGRLQIYELYCLAEVKPSLLQSIEHQAPVYYYRDLQEIRSRSCGLQLGAINCYFALARGVASVHGVGLESEAIW
jgi:hypothetical protein